MSTWTEAEVRFDPSDPRLPPEGSGRVTPYVIHGMPARDKYLSMIDPSKGAKGD